MVVRSSILALVALGLTAPILVRPQVAQAADVVGEGGVVASAAMPPVVADGRDVDVIFVALQADGTPLRGLQATATATAGVVGAFAELSPGVYRVPFHATGQRAQDVTITLKGATRAKQGFTATAALRLVPAPAAPQVRATPPAMMLGADEAATVTLTGTGPGALVRVSTGAVGATTDQPGGTTTARFTPGAERAPRVALITVADAADPERTAFLAIPLSGRVDFPVKGEPGASVALEVAGKRFGPVVLDASGRGQVAIEVPPGVTEGATLTTASGAETRKSVDLRIPEARRVALMPPGGSIPADPRLTVPLRVAVARADGAPDEEAAPAFTVSSGKVGAPKHLGGGVYEAAWNPGEAAGAATVTVSLGSQVQTDTVQTTLVQPPTGSLDIAVEGSLPASGGPFVVKVVPRGAGGAARPDVKLGWALDNATRSAEPSFREGAWVLNAEGRGSGPVRVTAWPLTEASRNPVAQVALVPERRALASDGQARVDVRVVAADRWGSPVPRAKVALALVEGGGALSATELVVGDDGVGVVTVTAGTAVGVAGLVATSGSASGALTLLQVPTPAVAKDVVIPSVGSEAQVAAADAWRGRVVTGRVDRADTGRVLPVVARVSLGADGLGRPGETVTLTASALDTGGKPLAGAMPVLSASAGTLTEPVAQPDGTVTAVLTVPTDHTGPIEVVATAGEREARLVVGDEEAGPAWVAAEPDAEPSPWEQPAPEPAVAEDDGPLLGADALQGDEPPPEPHRWLRLRGSVLAGTYRYEQAPSADPGPLLPSRLAVGGPDGGSPAAPVGGEADLRVFGDAIGVPWVGAHGQIRAAGYTITSSAFNGPASDMLINAELDLLLRYPFQVGRDQYWVGAKGGFHDNDFMVFTGCLEPGCQVKFEPVNVTGLGIGAEIGADVADRLHLIAGYTLGLAGGTDPYANAIDLDVGYEAIDRVFFGLGFTSISRSVVLEGADSGLPRGTLTDANMIFKLGAGIAL
ncbi:MAG: hypothetical protein H6735_31250 [Alphaproteobacteria bacterium]|nr:hypothetical protein [Alphaproteobacteria bacterium]